MTQTKNQQPKSYVTAALKSLPGSKIEITGSIAPEVWEAFRRQALKDINESVTIDGFRKGQVPENILIAKIGERAILEEMAEMALSRAYVDIVIDNKIDAIGKPEVHITKLALGNPLEFKAVTAIVPSVALPDYKGIAKKLVGSNKDAKIEVTDKDVEDAIVRIRKSRVSHESHDHDKMTPDEHEKDIMANLPELNDEFVKSLGGEFKDVADFKTKVKAMIGENKKDEAKEKLRIKIADALIDATKFELPEIMIESELNRTQSQFEADIEKMGVKLDDYLKHAKKSLDDIRKEWRPHAEKKAKLQLILNAIGESEKLKPDQKEIDNEVDHIIAHYKDADRERATVYAETVLTNEKVFQFLEESSVGTK